MLGRKKLFLGTGVTPACAHCKFGFPSADKKNILCEKLGIVFPDFSCKKYRYAPLKRIPRIPPAPAEFDPEDFML